MKRVVVAFLNTIILFLGLGCAGVIFYILIQAAMRMSQYAWILILGTLLFVLAFALIYVITPGDPRKKKEKRKNEPNNS